MANFANTDGTRTPVALHTTVLVVADLGWHFDTTLRFSPQSSFNVLVQNVTARRSAIPAHECDEGQQLCRYTLSDYGEDTCWTEARIVRFCRWLGGYQELASQDLGPSKVHRASDLRHIIRSRRAFFGPATSENSKLARTVSWLTVVTRT